MKTNGGEYHLLVSPDESCTAKIEGLSIKNCIEKKLLGVQFDYNLPFENHVTYLCKKESQKITPSRKNDILCSQINPGTY